MGFKRKGREATNGTAGGNGIRKLGIFFYLRCCYLYDQWDDAINNNSLAQPSSTCEVWEQG